MRAGRNIEGWRLRDIKRDEFPPNLGGTRMWQAERRKWQTGRLVACMQEAGGYAAGWEAEQLEDSQAGGVRARALQWVAADTVLMSRACGEEKEEEVCLQLEQGM